MPTTGHLTGSVAVFAVNPSKEVNINILTISFGLASVVLAEAARCHHGSEYDIIRSRQKSISSIALLSAE